MSKRKREAQDGLRDGAHEDQRAQQKHVESILQRSQHLLFQALKLARGFERQKLGRRQKAAKAAHDDSDSKRLESEVAALKVCAYLASTRLYLAKCRGQALDLYTTAEIHIYKSMLKTPSITSSPAFPSYIQSRLDEKSKPQNAAQANVQARLFNSQPVKKAMDDCMSSIRAPLGLNDLRNGKRRRIRKADYQKESNGEAVGEKPATLNGSMHTNHSGSEPQASTRSKLLLVEFNQGSDESLDHGEYGSRLATASEAHLATTLKQTSTVSCVRAMAKCCLRICPFHLRLPLQAHCPLRNP